MIFRRLYRTCLLIGFFAGAYADYWRRTCSARRPLNTRDKTIWQQRWAKVAARFLNLEIVAYGKFPSSGLLVSNHLSYLDVILLATLGPCVFVAKRDVAAWPFFGVLAKMGGAIFVDRRRPASVGSTLTLIEQALREGNLVVLFPEGTSSGGETVLRFRSSLLQAANGFPIYAGALRYLASNGKASEYACYWGDMVFATHLWGLLGQPLTRGEFLMKPSTPGSDRKSTCAVLWQDVNTLHAELSSSESPSQTANLSPLRETRS